jgi:hypothetical protein
MYYASSDNHDSFYTYSGRIHYTSNKYQSLHTFHSLAHHQFFHRFPEYPEMDTVQNWQYVLVATLSDKEDKKILVYF